MEVEKKSETSNKDQNIDENVFDIIQGVAITFGSLLDKKLEANIQHCDLFGKRNEKYKFLEKHNYKNCNFSKIQCESPFFNMIPSSEVPAEYENGISIRDIFNKYSSGVKTHRDAFAYGFNFSEMEDRISKFVDVNISDEALQKEFNLKDSPLWKMKASRAKIRSENRKFNLLEADYRPFDKRVVMYDKNIVRSMALPTMQHMLGGRNLALLLCQQQIEKGFRHIFVTRNISDCCSVSGKSRETTSIFPLKLNKEKDLLSSVSTEQFVSNISNSTIKAFEFILEKDALKPSSAILEYIYALLHSPTYRLRYGDHLKNDLPKILIPKLKTTFQKLRSLGSKLIDLHLLESSDFNQSNVNFVGSGIFRVEAVSYSDETVWIDKMKTKGFTNVPENVWDFQIGGYQVCHKWMKDRQSVGGKTPRLGRILSNVEINHYQNIINSISETIRIVPLIDETVEATGGWPDAFVIDYQK